MTGKDVAQTYRAYPWLLDCDRAIARLYDRHYFPDLRLSPRLLPPAARVEPFAPPKRNATRKEPRA